MRGDILSLENDSQAGETLIAPVMRGGKRLAAAPTLAQIREHAARELAKLPEPLRKLETGIGLSGGNFQSAPRTLAAQMDRNRSADPLIQLAACPDHGEYCYLAPARFQPRAPSPYTS